MENLGEFIVNHWILATLFVVLAWLVFSDALQQYLSGVKPLETNEAIQMVNQKKALFIDIRETEAFETEHIVDSKNMPLSTMTENIENLKDKSQHLILVCASGQRARTAAKQFREKGFLHLYLLNGGINAWKIAKLPLFS